MTKTIKLDKQEITYTLERKKVKNVNLRVRSDGSVYISANKRVGDDVIEEFLRKKTRFILSALDKYAEIAKYSIDNHNYVTGESFRYLGKDLRLVVSRGSRNVACDGIYLTLRVPDTDDEALKVKLIKKWYNAQCNEVFTGIITEIYPVFQKHRVAKPELRVREMSSRWGSCQHQQGVITLNKKLIETSRDCIEYVVMHEFIHFLHQNHSKQFYEMLSALMPDWKERKQHLEKIAV